MSNIKIEYVKQLHSKPDVTTIPFGTVFTDHIFQMNYDTEKGWFDPRIVPFQPISLSPAAAVYHYAQEIFEGLKAYRTPDGTVQLFRPTENVKRMNDSAARLCFPHIDEELFLEGLKQFIAVEKDWVPSEPGTSLYIRPFVIATEANLSVHASHSYLFTIIASPVGSYYKEGINPVKIKIEEEDVRAVRGGTGYTKCGGNYAASLRASERAESNGYSQVLWLDGVERKYIEEVGSMNVMFQIGDEIVTPKLTGSVLPGITRKSCIELMKSWGYKVSERLLSIDELISAIESGNLIEAWGTGTAAVVSPIGELSVNGKTFIINNNQIGELTQKLYDELTAIQWGKKADPFGWIVPVE